MDLHINFPFKKLCNKSEKETLRKATYYLVLNILAQLYLRTINTYQFLCQVFATSTIRVNDWALLCASNRFFGWTSSISHATNRRKRSWPESWKWLPFLVQRPVTSGIHSLTSSFNLFGIKEKYCYKLQPVRIFKMRIFLSKSTDNQIKKKKVMRTHVGKNVPWNISVKCIFLDFSLC